MQSYFSAFQHQPQQGLPSNIASLPHASGGFGVALSSICQALGKPSDDDLHILIFSDDALGDRLQSMAYGKPPGLNPDIAVADPGFP